MKNKMNVCFKLGFIFLTVCVGLLAAALVFGYIIDNESACTLFSLGGILLAFAGIILTLCSKPKKQKPKTEVSETIDKDI